MHTIWESFLQSEHAAIGNDDSSHQTATKSIYSVSQFGILTVSGSDAARLLQGQLTCNVNDIGEDQSNLAAFCNPKGRVITTILLVKAQQAYLLILPVDLLDTVKQRLQKYILRSAVTIEDSTHSLGLFGLSDESNTPITLPALEPAAGQLAPISVALPTAVNLSLVIASPEQAIILWTNFVREGFAPRDAQCWLYLNILAGIPWLDLQTTEEFIPQMLNLDKLGAISFNKGCYTGQEIVARTHYLGQSKRRLFLAEAHITNPPEVNTDIVDAESPGQSIGKVLQAACQQERCKMLVVLQTSENQQFRLKLSNQNQDSITVLTL